MRGISSHCYKTNNGDDGDLEDLDAILRIHIDLAPIPRLKSIF